MEKTKKKKKAAKEIDGIVIVNDEHLVWNSRERKKGGLTELNASVKRAHFSCSAKTLNDCSGRPDSSPNMTNSHNHKIFEAFLQSMLLALNGTRFF